jgi:hypothetical protein
MFQTYTLNGIRVLLADTGRVEAVQDALTGCAAALLYSRAQIAFAVRQACIAFESTCDLC